MGVINYRGNANFFKTDLKAIQCVKVRDSWSCCRCHKAIPKKSYCFGSVGYLKFCLKCGVDVCNNMINECKRVIELSENQINEVEKNKEKWELENTIGSL